MRRTLAWVAISARVVSFPDGKHGETEPWNCTDGTRQDA